MISCQVAPVSGVKGKITLPGDKSIAHRAVILAALSNGQTRIDNFPLNNDLLSTVSVFKKLGVDISVSSAGSAVSGSLLIDGVGLRGLRAPQGALEVGESGTTLRLILGVMAGQKFTVKLEAARSLSLRPMLRVTGPLRSMGARITASKRAQEEYPPIVVHGRQLHSISYNMPVASAQVKSALLLAGLYCNGITSVIEPVMTRDHSERMLKLFKARIERGKSGRSYQVKIHGHPTLATPGALFLPGDISSAAFFIVLATLCKGSVLTIERVMLNPSRNGILKVLGRMGARICLRRNSGRFAQAEPSGDMRISHAILRGTIVRRNEIPSLIDELPILMVAASLARGRTVLKGVDELKFKETDRITSMCENLRAMGARIDVKKDKDGTCIVIEGVKALCGARLKSYGDHRTAMSLFVAASCACGKSVIDDISCVAKSLPGFLKIVRRISSR